MRTDSDLEGISTGVVYSQHMPGSELVSGGHPGVSTHDNEFTA